MRIRTGYVAATGLAGLIMFAPTGTAEAQRGRGAARVPAGHLPPPGECRVWYDGRPPGQQPPPTDCASARRVASRRGARVIYGDERYDDRRSERDRDDRDRRDRRDRDDRDRRDRDRDDNRDRDDDRYDRCVDVNRDGRCDFGERDRDECIDRDGDGRCDYVGGYPGSVPEMVWGVIFGRGERQAEVRRIVGADVARAQVTDTDRNGMPETVTWLDANNRAMQRWIDDDRDGRADRIGIYENGSAVRVIRP